MLHWRYYIREFVLSTKHFTQTELHYNAQVYKAYIHILRKS